MVEGALPARDNGNGETMHARTIFQSCRYACFVPNSIAFPAFPLVFQNGVFRTDHEFQGPLIANQIGGTGIDRERSWGFVLHRAEVRPGRHAAFVVHEIRDELFLCHLAACGAKRNPLVENPLGISFIVQPWSWRMPGKTRPLDSLHDGDFTPSLDQNNSGACALTRS